MKNIWHNNGGKDYTIRMMADLVNKVRDKNLPLGKIGDVVNEIIECETVYVSLISLIPIEFMDINASIP